MYLGINVFLWKSIIHKINKITEKEAFRSLHHHFLAVLSLQLWFGHVGWLVADWALLHLAGLLFDLVVQIVHLFVLVHKRFELANVLVVEFDFSLHVLQISREALQFAFATMLTSLSLFRFFFNISLQVISFALVDFAHFPVLVFNCCNSLLLSAVLLLQMLLQVYSVFHVNFFSFFLGCVCFLLACIDLLAHELVLSSKRTKFFL